MEKTVTISENRVELPELATLFAGLLTTTDYKETATACDALLIVALDNPVTIVRRGDRIRVLLNTPNRKSLASGIVDAISHYFGDPSHTPANTNGPAIIIKRATAWAESQPDADWLNPQDYAGFVAMTVNDLLEKNNPTLSLKPKRFDEAERNAIVDKVQEWYNTKMEQPSNAQPLNDADTDRHPADSVPAGEQSAPMIIDYEIFKLLPDLYDILVSNGVIKRITKEDFLENIVKGVVPDMTPYSDHSWIKTIYKFKHTIKRIRPYFNNLWYNTVCSNAGLTADQMNKYNSTDAKTTGKRATYGTPTFEEELNRIGIKEE